MARRTSIWAATAGLLVILCVGALGFGDGRSTIAHAARKTDETPPRAQSAGEDGWRSSGPFGGIAQALALSPGFAADGFALAGGWKTGQMGRMGGYGIVRSTDRGASWEPVFATPPWSQLAVLDLAISPGFAADATAFAATETGILRTESRGAAWERLHGGLPEPGNDPTADDITRISLSPGFPLDGALLALQASGDLFLSFDRGNTWRHPAVPPLTAAAFSRNYAINGTLLAVAADGSLLRSTDRGATWAALPVATIGLVTDMLEAVDGAWLLATVDGVSRLVPAGVGYAVERVAPNIAGPVHRLALAGDRFYAAADAGLFISLSDGRRWDRYSDTPVTPFQSVATCPQWGLCHALLAGAAGGVLGTSDDNLVPWRWLGGLHRVAAASVVASPVYSADRTLFAGAADGLFRSTDSGGSWQITTPGERPDHDAVFTQVRISASYAVDGTLFATYEDRVTGRRGLYQSTDRGVTWSAQFAPFTSDLPMALAVSPAYRTDRTIFVAQDDILHKTTDGGATWLSYALAPSGSHFSTLDLDISSAYAADRTLFASGYGGVRRSIDGGQTWSVADAAAPSYGLAVSPAYATDRTIWHTFRSIEGAGDDTPDSGVRRSTDGGQTWQWTTAGLPGSYAPFPMLLAVAPNYSANRTLFTALSGPPIAGADHRLYRSFNGGQAWQALSAAPGNPNPADLAATTDALGQVAVHMASDSGVWHYSPQCEDRLVNGGFEVNAAWEFPITTRPAGYSDSITFTGQRSVRTGIDTPPDVYSYSSTKQALTIPAGVTSAVLRFAWYPLSAEPPLAIAARAEPSSELFRAFAQGRLPEDAFTGDWQYALLLNADGSMIPNSPRLWTRSNARAWQTSALDLAVYRGKTLQITFGTLNDGDGRSTAMYVDDVSLTTCWPELALSTQTPSPTPTATPPSTGTPEQARRVYLPFVLGAIATSTPTATATTTPTATPWRTSSPTATATTTPTATPTATATATSSVVPTAPAETWPTPYVLTTLALPAGSHPHGIALNAAGSQVYVAFHGVEHVGRSLGLLSTSPLSLLSQTTLGSGERGPNGVAVIEPSGRVVVANRQTANAAVVDANAIPPNLVGQISADLQPDGVIVQGGRGYIANFGSDTVTLFDPLTLAVTGVLHVGHEPALFTGDPSTGDVYLSLHGSNEILRINDGTPVHTYTGIGAPYGVAFDPISRRLYVANRGNVHTVTVIDVASEQVVGTIALGREPFVLAVNPRTGHLHVVCGDQVQVFRTLDWSHVITLLVPPGAEEGIAIDEARNLVYVTSREGDALTVIRDVAPPLVLFVSDRDGNGELYHMLPDGREQHRLTFTAEASEAMPAGAPDGRWIAYVRMGVDGWRHLWLMSRDGRNPQQLTFGAWDDLHPSWSGDGSRLAFASNRDGQGDIYTLTLANGVIARLTSDSAEDTNPAWAWRTGQIAFQSTRTSPNGEIWSMAADGTDVRRLTANFNGDRGPSWSPAGDYIAFWGSRAEQTLYKMRADGSEVTPLVSRSLRPDSPAWGPGSAGDWIVFSGYRAGSGYSEILRMTASGAGLALLTFNEVNFDYSPGWLPGQ